jgi:hypothetical protein
MAEFPAKLLKLLGDFPEKAEAMETADLKKELYSCEKIICAQEREMSEDAKLTGLKEEVKELEAPYKEMIAEHKAMVKYIVHVLEDRGDVVSKDEE